MKVTENYKQLLLKARSLRGKSGENAWQRAKILVAVFEDQEFRDEVGAVDDFKAAQMLNAEVEDLCLTFLQLREIIKAFPNKSEWADGRLRTLYQKTLDLKQPESDERPKRTRTACTLKDLEAETEARKDVESRLKYTEKQRDQFVSESDQLRAENRQLREEIATLKGRIQELERQASRYQETASSR